MFAMLRRLYPRGPDARGLVVDADGAMLGPDCVLVRRTPQRCRVLSPDAARAVQTALLGTGRDPDWLLAQCRRIAAALDRGETALAQIYGLHIPITELDAAALRRLTAAAALCKAGFNPDEPRIPAGQPGGGEWTGGGDDGGGDREAGSGSSGIGDGSAAGDGGDGPDSGNADGGDMGADSPSSPAPTDPAADSGNASDAGGTDGPSIEFTIPDQRPDTTKERNSIVRRSAEWLAQAAALGIAIVPDARIKAFLALLEATAWIVQYLPEIWSYLDAPKSLGELQDAVADPQPGYQVHHIVERQRRTKNPSSNWKVFGKDRLDSRTNLVRIPKWKHVLISSWYSTKNKSYGGLTPRAYLRGKGWDQQYRVDLEVLRLFKVLQ